MTAGDDELAGAWQAYHGGDPAAAQAACQRRLAANGDDVAALFLASLIEYERGCPRLAIDRLSRVVQLRPKYAEAHNNLGNAFAADAQLANAEKAFRQALRCKPDYAEAFNNLGNALRDQRKLDQAIDAYNRALQLRPDYAECHNNLGIALARKKRYDEAIVSYRRALALKPAFAEPQNNLGIVLAAAGQTDQAIEAFRWAVELKPNYVDAWANLALTLLDAGQLDDAIAAYRRAVALAPRSARLHNALGIALVKACPQSIVSGPSQFATGNGQRNTDHLPEAVAAFRSAIDLDADYAEPHNNLGNALRELGHLDEAEKCLSRALAIKPDYAEARNNLGIVLLKQRRLPDALAAYERALRHKPDYPEAHLNRALAWLAAGDFRRGWVEYEWRWRCKGFEQLQCSPPHWDGGLLDGKTVLLWAEQGLGDTLQFIRYARRVRERGARVLVRAPAKLHALLSRTSGIERLLSEDEPLPKFDCHAPLASLPRLFASTLDDVPVDLPYLFPDERLAERWRAWLGESVTESLVVGIAWQGNPRFAADWQRSLPLRALAPIADVAGVRLISLQKGAGAEQVFELADRASITTLGDDFDERAGAFMDTAAVIANLDLVITSDTAIAHLAGGMGVPVWVLLPRAADWRWLLAGEASPWYPTMRLFRQATAGDWEEVVSRVVDCLGKIVACQPATTCDRPVARCPQVAQGLVDRGVQLAERGELHDAIALFRRALRFQPELAEAHNNLGNALRSQGQLDDAVSHLQTALALVPGYAEARHNLGLVFARRRGHVEAIEQFQRAIDLKPDFALAWISMGLSQAEMRRHADAENSFRRALELEPRSPRVLNNLGNVLTEQGRRAEAVLSLRRAIEIDARCVDAHNNLGNALRELGELDDAIASFERAIAIRPEFPEAHNNLGITWAAKGDYQRAIACYQEALRIWPEYPAAHNNMGIALGHDKRFGDAIASYRRALELKPDYAEAYNNLGIGLSQEGEYQEAVARFRRAIELKPDYAEAYSNMGITLTELGQLDEALASYNKAVQLKENYPDAYMNRALAFLVRGDFERGWQEYESRWQCKDFNPRNFGKPRWNGEPLGGRRILLHAEQGFGDTFQFLRYARLVRDERGGRPVVWCPRPLVPLVSQCPYVEEVTIEGERLPDFDCHLPLLSLPKIFGTTLETIPGGVPYLFAKPELVEHWRNELSYINAFKIGINWQGNPRYRGDRYRSIPLEQFAPLAKIPGVRLVSLQKGLGAEQIPRLSSKLSVTELGAHRDETSGAFMDTAAILVNLDLVISSDTSLVHLAGGLGVPVWMALPRAADWRWLLAREDSPWYPTMRIFRQQEQGEWHEVFQRMTAEVAQLVERTRDCERLMLPVALEDLLDEIAALEVKLACDHNGSESTDRRRKLVRLEGLYRKGVFETEELRRLRADLRSVHESLLEAEQALRRCRDNNDAMGSLRWLKTIAARHEQRSTIKKEIGSLSSVDQVEGAIDALAVGRVQTAAQRVGSDDTARRSCDQSASGNVL